MSAWNMDSGERWVFGDRERWRRRHSKETCFGSDRLGLGPGSEAVQPRRPDDGVEGARRPPSLIYSS